MSGVVVLGAGIGGLALAHGLHRDGVEVTVLERRSSRAADGAALTIYGNGAAALAELGVDLDGCGALIDRLHVRRATGATAMRADLTRMATRVGPTRTVPRRVLIARIGASLSTVVRFDEPVTAVDRNLVTTSRDTYRGDVVVGADGHRSMVRSALGLAPARPVGWTTWQGLTTVLPETAAGTEGVLTVGKAGLVGTMPAGGGLTQWWFDLPVNDLGPRPLDALRQRFATYADPVPELLQAVNDADLGHFPHMLHEISEQWGRGTVTLLGDAAHVFPPTQAQGANQALEDAWLLRRAIRAGGDLAANLRRYESLRTPRVRLVSRMAASERTNRPASAVLAAFTRAVPAGVAGLAYARLVRRFSSVLNNDTIQ